MTCQEVMTFLAEHDNYLILTHRRPDGDAVGCSAALCGILRGMGKTAWVPGISDAAGTLVEYLADALAPADFVPETVVSVDLADAELLSEYASAWRDSVDLAIDHHPSNSAFARQTWLEGDKASCGELIYRIAQAAGVLDQAVADALYLAVASDCGCFVYSNTTANTHRTAAALMEAGADYRRLNKQHFRTKSMARMRLESLMLHDLHLYRGGSVAVAAITLDSMAEAGAGEEDAEDIASYVGQIRGVRHSATIRELWPNECKISLRTAAELDASRTCARLGGGGHAAAAGCVFHGSAAQAEAAIVAAIEAQLTESEQERGHREWPAE